MLEPEQVVYDALRTFYESNPNFPNDAHASFLVISFSDVGDQIQTLLTCIDPALPPVIEGRDILKYSIAQHVALDCRGEFEKPIKKLIHKAANQREELKNAH